MPNWPLMGQPKWLLVSHTESLSGRSTIMMNTMLMSQVLEVQVAVGPPFQTCLCLHMTNQDRLIKLSKLSKDVMVGAAPTVSSHLKA